MYRDWPPVRWGGITRRRSPIVAEAVERILDGRCKAAGVVSARAAFDAEDFLTSTVTGACDLGEIHALGHHALRTLPSGASGIDRSRTPQASKIAFAMAGAIATMGVSPPPADGWSGRSSSTTSISGRSGSRGTR